MVALNFNAQQFDPRYGGGGGLPAGKYKGVIVNTVSSENKDRTGGYLALELTPIEGPLAGTKHTDRLNLWHQNPQTVEIANKQLSAYCHVLGVFQVADSQQLCNIPFVFEIGPQKDNPQFTQVVAIYDVNGNEPGKAGAGPQPGAGAAPQGQPQGGFPPAGGAPQGGGFPPQGGQPQGGFPPAGGAPQGGFPPQGGAPQQGNGQGWGQPQGGAPQQGGGFPPQGGQPQGGFPPAGGAPQGGAPGGWSPGGAAPGGAAPWGAK